MNHGTNLLVDDPARGASLAVRASHVHPRMNEAASPGRAS